MESKPISRAFGFHALMIVSCVLSFCGEPVGAAICISSGFIFDAIKCK